MLVPPSFNNINLCNNNSPSEDGQKYSGKRKQLSISHVYSAPEVDNDVLERQRKDVMEEDLDGQTFRKDQVLFPNFLEKICVIPSESSSFQLLEF